MKSKIKISIGIDTENVIAKNGFPTYIIKFGVTASKANNNPINKTLIPIIDPK